MGRRTRPQAALRLPWRTQTTQWSEEGTRFSICAKAYRHPQVNRFFDTTQFSAIAHCKSTADSLSFRRLRGTPPIFAWACFENHASQSIKRAEACVRLISSISLVVIGRPSQEEDSSQPSNEWSDNLHQKKWTGPHDVNSSVKCSIRLETIHKEARLSCFNAWQPTQKGTGTGSWHLEKYLKGGYEGGSAMSQGHLDVLAGQE